MEIIVSVDGRNVPNFVQAEGQARFKVSFTPQEPKDHVISVKFNGQSVPGRYSTTLTGNKCVDVQVSIPHFVAYKDDLSIFCEKEKSF